MYLSRVRLQLNRLTPSMLDKWGNSQPYVAHQWLWQLFPQHVERTFLFRQEPGTCFYVLSQAAPVQDHGLFSIETKAFQPQISDGMRLDFRLRANPVITRQKKRFDVLMDAKFQAKARGVEPAAWRRLQEQAAQDWLVRQGEQHGFSLMPSWTDWEEERPAMNLVAYDQHRFIRRAGEQPVVFSSADYAGSLVVSDVEKFRQALFYGIGKSKALGCGLLMVRRGR